MQQKLTAALQTLYSTRKDAPHLIRMMMQMSDPIDRAVLRSAVDVTMQRYPYFCVELRKNDGQYVFEHNTRPVVISDTLGGTELNSESSNYHMIAFSAENDWIVLDVFHGLTDGIGAYEVIRTLLYYYCSQRYDVKLSIYDPDGGWITGGHHSGGERLRLRIQSDKMNGAHFTEDPHCAAQNIWIIDREERIACPWYRTEL